MSEACEQPKSDLAGSPRSTLLIWGLPGLAMALTGGLSLGVPYVWPPAQLWMGGACAMNAFRCRRVHCYFTAVFFTGMALVSLLQGLGTLPAGAAAWLWNGGLTAGGGVLLTWLPERILGQYFSPENSC